MERRNFLASGAVLALAGCSGGDNEEFRTEPIVFTRTRATEFDEYERQPDAIYRQGDTVWFYVAIHNAMSADGTVEFLAEFEVTLPDGRSLSDEETVEVDVTDKNLENTFITNGLHTDDSWPTGEYEVSVTVTDQIADESDSSNGQFILEQ